MSDGEADADVATRFADVAGSEDVHALLCALHPKAGDDSRMERLLRGLSYVPMRAECVPELCRIALATTQGASVEAMQRALEVARTSDQHGETLRQTLAAMLRRVDGAAVTVFEGYQGLPQEEQAALLLRECVRRPELWAYDRNDGWQNLCFLLRRGETSAGGRGRMAERILEDEVMVELERYHPPPGGAFFANGVLAEVLDGWIAYNLRFAGPSARGKAYLAGNPSFVATATLASLGSREAREALLRDVESPMGLYGALDVASREVAEQLTARLVACTGAEAEELLEHVIGARRYGASAGPAALHDGPLWRLVAARLDEVSVDVLCPLLRAVAELRTRSTAGRVLARAVPGRQLLEALGERSEDLFFRSVAGWLEVAQPASFAAWLNGALSADDTAVRIRACDLVTRAPCLAGLDWVLANAVFRELLQSGDLEADALLDIAERLEAATWLAVDAASESTKDGVLVRCVRQGLPVDAGRWLNESDRQRAASGSGDEVLVMALEEAEALDPTGPVLWSGIRACHDAPRVVSWLEALCREQRPAYPVALAQLCRLGRTRWFPEMRARIASGRYRFFLQEASLSRHVFRDVVNQLVADIEGSPFQSRMAKELLWEYGGDYDNQATSHRYAIALREAYRNALAAGELVWSEIDRVYVLVRD